MVNNHFGSCNSEHLKILLWRSGTGMHTHAYYTCTHTHTHTRTRTHTHTHMHMHTYTHICINFLDKSNVKKNQACTDRDQVILIWKCQPDMKMLTYHSLENFRLELFHCWKCSREQFSWFTNTHENILTTK